VQAQLRDFDQVGEHEREASELANFLTSFLMAEASAAAKGWCVRLRCSECLRSSSGRGKRSDPGAPEVFFWC